MHLCMDEECHLNIYILEPDNIHQVCSGPQTLRQKVTKGLIQILKKPTEKLSLTLIDFGFGPKCSGFLS